MGILDNAKLKAVMKRDSKDALKDKTEDLKEDAIGVYNALNVLEHHKQYVSSFQVLPNGDSYVLYNGDSETFWVEYGAHAGGKTFVLGYAPMRTAIDIEAAHLD